jgi:hypothetical protein
VRNRFTGGWSEGFVIEAGDTPGDLYRIRRVSDDTLLPVAFPNDALRTP